MIMDQIEDHIDFDIVDFILDDNININDVNLHFDIKDVIQKDILYQDKQKDVIESNMYQQDVVEIERDMVEIERDMVEIERDIIHQNMIQVKKIQDFIKLVMAINQRCNEKIKIYKENILKSNKTVIKYKKKIKGYRLKNYNLKNYFKK